MFVEGQSSVKNELIKRYPSKDFFYIDEEEDEEEQEEDRQNDTHSSGLTFTENVIIIDNVIGAREGVSEEDPPAL